MAFLREDGEPWFVDKDVAEVLGYSKPRNTITEHCNCPELLRRPKSGPLSDTNSRGMTTIPERDLYRLIMRSKMPKAEAFDGMSGGISPLLNQKTGRHIQGEGNAESEESS